MKGFQKMAKDLSNMAEVNIIQNVQVGEDDESEKTFQQDLYVNPAK